VSIKAYFVQYRFILPESIKHSSYTYQKLFRAIYGYTQAVNKSSGKTYKYHRPGVLSKFPYIRPGKNCVIVPQAAFQPLQDFFKTGHNPAHNWETKGEWKCTYFLNEKEVDEKGVAQALENLLSRKFVVGSEGPVKLSSELERVAKNGAEQGYKDRLLADAQSVVDNDWFRGAQQHSPQLVEFYSFIKTIKGGSTTPQQAAPKA